MGKKLRKKKQNPTIFIFCEGETEKCYFSALKDIKGNKVKFRIETIKFRQFSTSRTKIKADVSSVYNKIKSEFGFTKNTLSQSNSYIYLLLDADVYSKDDITQIQNYCLKENIIVLFSNPDFELFILLHIEEFKKMPNLVIDRIKTFFSDYDKGYNLRLKNIHKEIIKKGENHLSDNIKRIELLTKHNTHIKDRFPFTELYEIYKLF